MLRYCNHVDNSCFPVCERHAHLPGEDASGFAGISCDTDEAPLANAYITVAFADSRGAKESVDGNATARPCVNEEKSPAKTQGPVVAVETPMDDGRIGSNTTRHMNGEEKSQSPTLLAEMHPSVNEGRRGNKQPQLPAHLAGDAKTRRPLHGTQIPPPIMDEQKQVSKSSHHSIMTLEDLRRDLSWKRNISNGFRRSSSPAAAALANPGGPNSRSSKHSRDAQELSPEDPFEDLRRDLSWKRNVSNGSRMSSSSAAAGVANPGGRNSRSSKHSRDAQELSPEDPFEDLRRDLSWKRNISNGSRMSSSSAAAGLANSEGGTSKSSRQSKDAQEGSPEASLDVQPYLPPFQSLEHMKSKARQAHAEGRNRFKRNCYWSAAQAFTIAMDLYSAQSISSANPPGTLCKVKELREFLAYLDSALRLDANFMCALFTRALLKYELGDLDGAIKGFDEYLAMAPCNYHVLSTRAEAKERKGDQAGASCDFMRAQSLRPVVPQQSSTVLGGPHVGPAGPKGEPASQLP